MRNCTQYTAEFKEQLLAKVFSPNSSSRVELAKQAGVPYGTLHTWIKMSKNKNVIASSTSPLRPESQLPETKLRAVIETLDKTEAEKSAYCRAHGFYSHHLEAWRAQMLTGLGSVATSKKERVEYQELTKEIKQLKSDLNRKDKALAEVSALLILKKKADLLWGDSEAS